MLFSRFAIAASFMAAVPLGIAQFSYDESTGLGPSKWASLEIEDNQCGGSKNSPIAIESSDCTVFGDYKLMAGDCSSSDLDFAVEKNGVMVSYPDTCELNKLEMPMIEGVYEALQFHIHTSSEHTIDDGNYGAELHIVHKAVDEERYAVVGMLLEPTAAEDNPLFNDVLGPIAQNAVAVANVCGNTCPGVSVTTTARQSDSSTMNIYDLLPSNPTFYHYDGGLTTPPCSEVVWWNLAAEPVGISVAQFHMLTSLTLNYLNSTTCEFATIASPSGSTSRPPQPLNGRKVDRVCPTSTKGSALEESAAMMTTALGAVAAAGVAVMIL